MNEPAARDDTDRLVSLVHDLRTPLTIVSGFAELLVKSGDRLTPEQSTEYLERIKAAADDMKRLLDEERAERLT